MNEKQIKQVYNDYAQKSAPDMDKLWEKINIGLEEKSENRITSTESPEIRRKKIATTKQLSVAAACVALIIAVPAFLSTMTSSKSSDMKSNALVDNADTAAAENLAPNNSFEDVETNTTQMDVVYYEQLNLSETSTFVNTINSAPRGDDYFVQENVLAQTEFFMDVIVENVYLSNAGDEFVYELKRAGNKFDENCPESLTIKSATDYIMLENREYLLPLKTNTYGEYELVFENAPQIEITLDGGMIFHNGWGILDNGDCADVIYPKGKADDFFYDRMKFSYTSDLPRLLEKWVEIRNSN